MIVSPEFTRSTGGWALLNQPHWVVSMVAGSRCVLPGSRLAGTVRSASCSGVEAGAIGAGAGCAAGGCAGGCCATAKETPSKDAAAAADRSAPRAARPCARLFEVNMVERLPWKPGLSRAAISLHRSLNGASPSHWYSGIPATTRPAPCAAFQERSEEHTSELQS